MTVCAQKADIQAINSCSINAVQDLNNKMGGEKLDLSTSQREKMNTAATAYGQCVSLALTAANTSQNAGGFGALASDLSTTAEKEAKEKAALEKFKSDYKTCLSNFATKGKEILSCD